MWRVGQKVTITGYNKHKAVVKKCMNENHHIIATAQRTRFREAKEKLAEGYYLVGDDIGDVSRALCGKFKIQALRIVLRK